jgi:Tol biopolymer transport system component
MNRFRLILLVGFLVFLGSGLIYWWFTPRILAVSPLDGATDIPAGTAIRVTFSLPMQEQTLKEHLILEPPMEGSITWEDNTLVFDPQTPWPAGQTITATLEGGSRSAGLLPFSHRGAKTWSFKIRQPSLLYLYPSEGPVDIFRINPQTGKSDRLTDTSGGVINFSVTSSGTQIYYSVRNGQGSSEIFILDLVKQESAVAQDNLQDITQINSPQFIISCPKAICRVPSLSPEGDFLAYERTVLIGNEEPTYPQVWFIPINSSDAGLEGKSKSVPTLAGDPDHQTMQPSWSPDGLLTFYDTTASAFIFLDPHSGESTSFLNQTGQPGDWHPEGREYVAAEIFFNDENTSPKESNQEFYMGSHLIQYNRFTGTTRDISNAENLEDTWPSFSPDGTYLAFARKYLDTTGWTPGRQLWLMESGWDKAQQLTDEPLYNHFGFVWSPAGDQLAFVRFNQSALTEPTEIWLIDMSTYWATSLVEGGFAPQWIP